MDVYEKEIVDLLAKTYPNPKSSLDFSNPLELLVATILSAQCTDKRVNIVTKDLFKKYKSAQDYANAVDLASDIKSINFYNNKAKNIKKTAQILATQYNGEVPQTMDALLALPGVARKTANVVLTNAFHRNVGFVVDTHVKRVSGRLGITTQSDPVKIEKDLMSAFDRKYWGNLSHQMIFLGREICVAREPKCAICPLRHICRSSTAK